MPPSSVGTYADRSRAWRRASIDSRGKRDKHTTETDQETSAVRAAARIARIGYREGKFDQTALLDVERSLTETRLAAVDALAAYHEARARLDRLTAAVPVETRR